MPFPITPAKQAQITSANYDLDYDAAIRIGSEFARNGARTVYVVSRGDNSPEVADHGYALHLTNFPAGAYLMAIITPMGVIEVLSQPLRSPLQAEASALDNMKDGGAAAVIAWHDEPGIWRAVRFNLGAIRAVQPKIGSWYAPAKVS